MIVTGLPEGNPYWGAFGRVLFNLSVWWQGPMTLDELLADLSFPRWVAFAWNADPFPVSRFVQNFTVSDLPEDVAAAYVRVGDICRSLRKDEEAHRAYKEALRIFAQLLKESPDDARRDADRSRTGNAE